MSLIHKALKKTEERGPADQFSKPELPVEEFIGHKKGFIAPSITPRTLVLIVLLVLAVIYLGYMKFFKKSPSTVPNAAAPATETASETSEAGEALPTEEKGALASKGVLERGGATTNVVGPTEKLPDDARELDKEAKELFANGQLNEALKKFKEAVNIVPDDPTLLNNIGLIYKKQENFTEAERYYHAALKLSPNYPECLNNLGVLKAAQEIPLDAALYFKKAIELKSSYADPYFNLAILMENEGNFKSAVENYKLFLKYAKEADSSLLEQVRSHIEELSE